jgi:hypothetical protein
MTQDEIIEMAKEAGWNGAEARSAFDALKVFAEILAARLVPKERAECAYRADIALLGADRGLANRVNQAIRTRGEA